MEQTALDNVNQAKVYTQGASKSNRYCEVDAL